MEEEAARQPRAGVVSVVEVGRKVDRYGGGEQSISSFHRVRGGGS